MSMTKQAEHSRLFVEEGGALHGLASATSNSHQGDHEGNDTSTDDDDYTDTD
jgi:hypothetical protein